MPQRVSNKVLSSAVGRMIFRGGAEQHHIAHKLNSLGKDRLQASLIKHGLPKEDVKSLSKVLAGKTAAGRSHGDMKKIVAVLQDVGLASHARGASEMVLHAAKAAAAAGPNGAILSPEQMKARLKEIARERRSEASAPAEKGPVGVLDRARGAQGRANKLTSPTTESGSINELRTTMRSERTDAKLAPKISVQTSMTTKRGSAPFQA